MLLRETSQKNMRLVPAAKLLCRLQRNYLFPSAAVPYYRLHSLKPACSKHFAPFRSLSVPLQQRCLYTVCLWPNLPPATEWGYGIQGPETWPSKYPQAGGKNQSPVDIVTSLAKNIHFDQQLSWHYGPMASKSVINTGCGWRVDLQDSGAGLTGGPLSQAFSLVQFHCHWGNCGTCGSEHTVDGKAYAGELHFVHWNKELFESCAEAVQSPNGLTVIGVFLEEGEKNEELEKICAAISEIPARDDRVDLQEEVNPVAMFPAEHGYWTYSGSLTTPPCYESVNWIVFKKPITVSQEQLNVFRQMKKPCDHEDSESASCVDHNYRPPQLLNEREIYNCD